MTIIKNNTSLLPSTPPLHIQMGVVAQ